MTRKAKVAFEHTPEWPYFDLRKRAPFTGWPGTRYHIEVLAVPQDDHEDGTTTLGTPYWVQMEDITHNDVLPHETWDAVLDAIDEQCRREDAERRRVAAKAAAPRARGTRTRQ